MPTPGRGPASGTAARPTRCAPALACVLAITLALAIPAAAQVPPLPVPLPPLPVPVPPPPPVPDVGAIPTELTFAFDPPNSTAQPGRVFVVPMELHYTYLETAPATNFTIVQYNVTEAPPWATVTVTPPLWYFLINQTPCACERTQVAPVFLLVTAKADAPPFEPGVVRFRAEASVNGAYAGSEAEGEVEVEAGYRSKLDVKLDPPILYPEGPGAHDVNMTLANLGNAPTAVRFEAGMAPLGTTLEAPAGVTLAVGGVVTVVWRVQVAEGAEDGNAQLKVVSAYAADPAVAGGEELTKPLRIDFEELRLAQARQEQEEPNALPGPSLALAAVVLGAMAAALRRRA